MPCQDRQSLPSPFPSFPADFKSDTPYFQKALAEENFHRIALGLLPVHNFTELNHTDRTKVLADAQALKDADRAPAVRSWWYRHFIPIAWLVCLAALVYVGVFSRWAALLLLISSLAALHGARKAGA